MGHGNFRADPRGFRFKRLSFRASVWKDVDMIFIHHDGLIMLIKSSRVERTHDGTPHRPEVTFTSFSFFPIGVQVTLEFGVRRYNAASRLHSRQHQHLFSNRFHLTRGWRCTQISSGYFAKALRCIRNKDSFRELTRFTCCLRVRERKRKRKKETIRTW